MTKEVLVAKCKLYDSFPDSYINHNGEFIAHEEANEYFNLKDCETQLDVECKVLEWLSRAAYKTEPFYSDVKNQRFHSFMLDGINHFLGTKFTEDDMETIYTYLGNRCNHPLTVAFVKSGYDIALLLEKGEKTE